MDFAWDEIKRQRTIRDRGLDFADADLIFAGPHLRKSARTVAGEERWIATGPLGEAHVTVVFTIRGSVIRIISMRRARHEERERYQDVFGR